MMNFSFVLYFSLIEIIKIIEGKEGDESNIYISGKAS